MGRIRLPADEEAFLTAIRKNPGDTSLQLVYADWLQERGQGDPASFLRLRASLPFLLKDGDTEAQRHDLNRNLKSRAKLREMRKGLDRTWLTALGDLGLVGEVVVTTLLATACTVTFGIIIKETPKTVAVAKLRSRLVSGDSQDGLVRPRLPSSKELAALLTTGSGTTAQKQPGGDEFTNDRRFERWQFWEGNNHSDYGD